MPRIITSFVIAICFTWLASTAQTAMASFLDDSVIAFSLQGTGFATGAFSTTTLGYSFTTSQPLTISALGAYDGGGTSIAAEGGTELVNLFDVAGSHTIPLISATVVTADLATSLSGGAYTSGDAFRFHPLVTPYILPAGSYQLMESPGLIDGNIPFRLHESGTVHTGITFGVDQYSSVSAGGPDAGFGNNSFGNGFADFGPNFLIAPEPTSAALLGLAIVAMAWCRGSRPAVVSMR